MNVALESKYIVSLAEGADPREVIGDSDGDGVSNDYEGEFAFLDRTTRMMPPWMRTRMD